MMLIYGRLDAFFELTYGRPFLTGSSQWDMIRQIIEIFPSIEESWPDVIHCEQYIEHGGFPRFINKNANKVPLNMKQFLTIDPARRVSTNTLQTRYLNEDIIVEMCSYKFTVEKSNRIEF